MYVKKFTNTKMHLCANTLDVLLRCIDSANEADHTLSLGIVRVQVVVVDVQSAIQLVKF